MSFAPYIQTPEAELAVLSMVHLEEFPELPMPDHDRWPPLSEPPTLVDEDSLTTALIKTVWGTRPPCLSTRPVQGASPRPKPPKISNRVPPPLALDL
ncbi:hypothetical protein CDEST_07748 [Colletotrichum destructivum]|uniref:Uncharacterized protein n=1 Tax=Colletotrichum destructivum TaxID=34406 RepID=A0AAX4IIS9_9PEZI|nr:hypothetical protein CDEST_07748 [Colletotrichum destructivum]